jgi:hypothetical protein
MLNELGRKNIKKRIETFKKNVRKRAGIPEDSVMAPWEIKRELSYKKRTGEELKKFNKERVTEKWRQSSKLCGKKLNEVYWKTDEGKKRREELSKTQLKNALKSKMDMEDRRWLEKFDATKDYRTIQQIKDIYGGGSVAVRRRLSIIGYVLKKCKKTQEQKQSITDKKDEKWLNKFDNTKNYESINEIRRIYGGSRIDILRRLKKINFINVESFSKKYSSGQNSHYNHKVVSVKIIKSETEIPVYDIEVPLTSNFALSSGIFVHNSKDLSDAVGQIIYNMHVNPMCSESPMFPVALHNSSDISSRETLEDTLENFNKWVMKG